MRKIAVSSKAAEQDPIEVPRRSQVVAERLFDDDAAPRVAVRLGELLDDQCRTARAESPDSGPAAARRRAPCGAPGTSPGRCSRRPHSAASRTASRTPRRSRPPCFSRLSARPRLELVEIPARLGHADHRHVEVAALHHRLQRREDLLVGQIARGAEEHQRVGMSRRSWCVHLSLRRLLHVAAELEAHRREQLVLEVRFTARAESLVERGGQHRHRHGFVDRRLDRPATFARIRNPAGELARARDP